MVYMRIIADVASGNLILIPVSQDPYFERVIRYYNLFTSSNFPNKE